MSRDEFGRLFDEQDITGGAQSPYNPLRDNYGFNYNQEPYHMEPKRGLPAFEWFLLACIVAAVLLLVLTIVGRAGAAPVMSSPEQEQVVAPSCQVDAGEGYGSGTLINLATEREPYGKLYVLTCSHVVELAAKEAYVTYTNEDGEEVRLDTPVTVTCRMADGRKFEATVVFWNKEYATRGPDLALCRADVPEDQQDKFAVAHLPNEQVQFKIGEPFWYCGWGSGVPHSLERTIINHVDEQYIRSNGLGWYGHSGSGCYVERDGRYQVVGVLVLLAASGPRAPVLSGYKILEFIDSYKKTLKAMPKAD